MELTPQLLTDEIDFRIAVRGYDRNEVDDFLERVAVAVGQLQAQLAKALERAKVAEERQVGQPSKEAAPLTDAAPVRETEPVKPSEPAKVVAPAEPSAADVATEADLNDELRRTLVLAQRTADTAIREANEEATRILAAAQVSAKVQTDEAAEASRRDREEARGRLVEEINELERIRESMRSDIKVLERYLGEERARVRETIQVLRRLVDDPKSFEVAVVPELSGVNLPEEPRELGTGEPSGESAIEVVEAADEEAIVDGADEDLADDGPVVDLGEAQPSPKSLPPRAPRGEVEAEVESQTEPAVTDSAEAPDLGRLFESDEHADWRSGGASRGDQGPHTQPVAVARFEEEPDDAFLAELRQAMSDNEPLGPDQGDSKR